MIQISKFTLILIGCILQYSLLAFEQNQNSIELKIAESRSCSGKIKYDELSIPAKFYLDNRCSQKYASCGEVQNLEPISDVDSIFYFVSFGDCLLFSPKQNSTEAYKNYIKAYKIAKNNGSKVFIVEVLHKLIAFNLYARTNTKETDGFINEHKEIAYDELERLHNLYYQIRINQAPNDINNPSLKFNEKDWDELLLKLGDKYPKLESEIRSTYGIFLEFSKNLDKAEDELLKSIDAAQMVNDEFYQDAKFSSLANIGFMKLDNRQDELALNYFMKAKQVKSRMSSDKNSALLYEWISTCYSNMGKSDSAYHYLSLASDKNKSAADKDHASKIQEIQSKYDNEKLNNDLLVEQTKKQRSNILAGLFIGLSLISLLIYRNQKIKTQSTEQELENLTLKSSLDQQKALEKERVRIAAEMHDDLGGGLTTIKFLSEKVLKNIEAKQDKLKVEKIVSHSKSLVNNMSEIIWAMNAGFDTLDSLIGYTRRFAAEYMEDHDMDMKFSVAGETKGINLSGERRRSVFLVIKEALHNIVKHAYASNAEITFTVSEKIDIEIKDNGQGFKPEVNLLGNGLHNMKKRIEKINGNLTIESKNGTSIVIALPYERVEEA